MNKLFIGIFSDILSMSIVWIVLVPLASAMSQNFTNGLISIITIDLWQLIIPVLITISFFLITGFYKSMVRFYDLLDTFFVSISGSLVFGFTWY